MNRTPPVLQRGLVVNDTIVIRYQIELVVSTGGALSRHASASNKVRLRHCCFFGLCVLIAVILLPFVTCPCC